MLKLLVLVVLLCHEIRGISGETEGEFNSGEESLITLIASNPLNNGTQESVTLGVPVPNGLYLNAVNQTVFYIDQRDCPRSTSEKLRSDYTLSRGIGAHKVHNRLFSWNTARRMCAEEGGHLAIIRTFEEALAVKSLMDKASVAHAWVGFHDLFQEGDWVTVLDEPVAKMEWSMWDKRTPNIPNNYGGNENCGVFLGSQLAINDDRCANPYAFVCKINIST